MFRDSYAEIVIARFDGIRGMARALGHRNPTTVQRWQATGFIPSRHWPRIQELAFARGWLDLTVRWLGEAHAQQELRRSQKAAQKAAAEAPETPLAKPTTPKKTLALSRVEIPDGVA